MSLSLRLYAAEYLLAASRLSLSVVQVEALPCFEVQASHCGGFSP